MENNNGTAKILTKDINDIEIKDKDVPIGTLFNYSLNEPIIQNYKPGEANMNEEELLETYVIN